MQAGRFGAASVSQSEDVLSSEARHSLSALRQLTRAAPCPCSLLINALEPGTVDARAIRLDALSASLLPPPLASHASTSPHLERPPPPEYTAGSASAEAPGAALAGVDGGGGSGGAAAAVQTAAPEQQQDANCAGLAAVEAASAAGGEESAHAAAVLGAAEGGKDEEEGSGVLEHGKLLMDLGSINLDADWFASPPAPEAAKSGDTAAARAAKEEEEERRRRQAALWNWQLAHGSALALGCALEGLHGPALAAGGAEPLVAFVMELLRHHYMQVCFEWSGGCICLESSAGPEPSYRSRATCALLWWEGGGHEGRAGSTCCEGGRAAVWRPRAV